MKVIKNLGVKPYGKEKREKWIVECPICKKHFEVLAKNVKSGKSTKCINCSASIRKKTHGMTGTKLHNTWMGMKARCYNKKSASFNNYGGRGISVCDEWINDFVSFMNWSNSNGFNSSLSIDRIDNDGNYEPSNCRWTTRAIQARNTRVLKSTNTSGFRGVTFNKECGMWISQIGINGIQKRIGKYTEAINAAIAYDDYIQENNLEHTKNF